MGQGEGSGFCSNDGKVEELLGPGDGGASTNPEMPEGMDKRTHKRLLDKWYAVHPACALVLAALLALILTLVAAVAVLSGRCGGNPTVPAALVLACPEDWVAYGKVCYHLSREEGSWEWSQEQCSSLGASLAVLRMRWEMGFLLRLKGNADYWLGLRRQGERLEWVNGSSFNHTFPVHGQGACVYLNDDAAASSSCSQQRPYICSKPQALM
ncbi:C-type lectin domain family 2 member B-like [Gavia stellata]|uniref:C-type lectin domain family 2 member B-like n=1 Tax=Gavia stellata TaxID=37040 RepID=UPI00289D26AC|nr:C-type lectin domain family 2 member B-like [Gavia stellata]